MNNHLILFLYKNLTSIHFFNNLKESMNNLNINDEFPLSSQTTEMDKLVLLKIRDIVARHGSYKYLEIGSYLGGSLPPFLNDKNCKKVLSIDDRGKKQKDERGANYDYTEITTEMMLKNLDKVNLDYKKLETFDGSIDDVIFKDEMYDLIFIDGEHTDRACFRDFIFSKIFFKDDCIVMFHDSSYVYRSTYNDMRISQS